jgi:DNA-binding MarR family transcriptional regulator
MVLMSSDLPPDGSDPSAEEFTDLLSRLFNKAAAIERDPVDTGDGVLLHASEVHLLDMAGRFPQESMTALAVRLGITKGAISQTVTKLEEKGYLERMRPEGNNRTVHLRLTAAGLRAFTWHRAYHAIVNRRIARQVAGLDQKERDAIRHLFRELEQVFDDCPEIRQRVRQGPGDD